MSLVRSRLLLLLLSLWFFTIAFVIDNYWSSGSSLNTVQKDFTNYVAGQESDFQTVAKDRQLLDKIKSGKLSESDVNALFQKKYFYFCYTVSPSGSDSLLFWNTQNILPATFMLYNNPDKGFVRLKNGYYVWERKAYTGVTSLMLQIGRAHV